MEKMKIQKEKRGEWDVVKLSGPINEEAGVHLIKLYNETGKKCVFNFKDVAMVNSNGIRNWVLFLRDFQNDRTIEMEECAPVIVDQMNMLPSFVQKAKIRSVFVPYECSSCNQTTNVLVESRDFPAEGGGTLRQGRCKKCAAPTQAIDELDYFAFLQFTTAA